MPFRISVWLIAIHTRALDGIIAAPATPPNQRRRCRREDRDPLASSQIDDDGRRGTRRRYSCTFDQYCFCKAGVDQILDFQLLDQELNPPRVNLARGDVVATRNLRDVRSGCKRLRQDLQPRLVVPPTTPSNTRYTATCPTDRSYGALLRELLGALRHLARKLAPQPDGYFSGGFPWDQTPNDNIHSIYRILSRRTKTER